MGPASTRTHAARQQLRAAWTARTTRERSAITGAALAVAAALLWGVALAPAINTLRQAPAQVQALQSEIAGMQELGRSARALQTIPALDAAATLRQFQDATQRLLGAAARTTQTGTLLRVTLESVSAADLADWLADVRTSAHLLPTAAQLARDDTDTAARWSGTLSFNLPA